MSEGIRYCDRCSQPIRGEHETVPQFSASGARPDSYRHKPGDTACKPWPQPSRIPSRRSWTR